MTLVKYLIIYPLNLNLYISYDPEYPLLLNSTYNSATFTKRYM